MVNEKTQRLQKVLLIVVSIGLTPIALSYGLMPTRGLEFLMGIEVSNPDLAHILRAVMGLYLALVVFWIMGAVKPELRKPALYSMLELSFGTLALLLVRKD